MSDDRRLANIEKMLGKLTSMKTTDEMDTETVGRIFDDAPKTFKTCGHPFPRVSCVTMSNDMIFAQRYTCAQCGNQEEFP